MPKNPIVVIIAPSRVTFDEPIFEIIKPEVGPNASDVTENGNCI